MAQQERGPFQGSANSGPPQSGPFSDMSSNKKLVEAMSIIGLSNKCFKKCIVPAKPRLSEQAQSQIQNTTHAANQEDPQNFKQDLNASQNTEGNNQESFKFAGRQRVDPQSISPKTRGVLEYLEMENDYKNRWLLSEKETICIHNCAKSYVELKGFLHEQLLKDYSFVRKKNRKLFEND